MEHRRELLPDRHGLPGRFWEPQPEEEDLARMEREYEDCAIDDEPLPFE